MKPLPSEYETARRVLSKTNLGQLFDDVAQAIADERERCMLIAQRFDERAANIIREGADFGVGR
jgi:hypothetical protein